MAKTTFSAMLAAVPDNFEQLRKATVFPLLASFKLDGIRGINRFIPNIGCKLVSRSDISLPSAFAQRVFGVGEYCDMDGELIAQPERFGNIYKDSFSAVMTHGAENQLKWYVFDIVRNDPLKFGDRIDLLHKRYANVGDENWELIEQKWIHTWDELLEYENKALDLGYEGLILRHPDGPYKFGRSTLKQFWMAKMVRIAIEEVEITGFYEGLHNGNEAIVDSRGYTTRSSHQEFMVGKGLVGGFNVRDVKHGWEFKIGVADGLDIATREKIWKGEIPVIGKISRYKYKPYGMDAVPRHPVLLWGQWRDPIDM